MMLWWGRYTQYLLSVVVPAMIWGSGAGVVLVGRGLNLMVTVFHCNGRNRALYDLQPERGHSHTRWGFFWCWKEWGTSRETTKGRIENRHHEQTRGTRFKMCRRGTRGPGQGQDTRWWVDGGEKKLIQAKNKLTDSRMKHHIEHRRNECICPAEQPDRWVMNNTHFKGRWSGASSGLMWLYFTPLLLQRSLVSLILWISLCSNPQNWIWLKPVLLHSMEQLRVLNSKSKAKHGKTGSFSSGSGTRNSGKVSVCLMFYNECNARILNNSHVASIDLKSLFLENPSHVRGNP